jgi:hypothetical protein
MCVKEPPAISDAPRGRTDGMPHSGCNLDQLLTFPTFLTVSLVSPEISGGRTPPSTEILYLTSH